MPEHALTLKLKHKIKTPLRVFLKINYRERLKNKLPGVSLKLGTMEFSRHVTGDKPLQT